MRLCLLSSVDRLPTISEMQESDIEDGDIECSGYTMEEYVDSIKELSQPAQRCYPLHGPLKGHRRWMTSDTPSILLHCPGTYTQRSPIEVSEVSLTVTDRSSRYLNQNALDRLIAQSVFAGLV